MYLCNNLNDIVAEGRVGWTSWRDPFQVHYSLGTSEHVDVNLMYPPGKYIYRAVLIKDHHVWYLLHHSVMFEERLPGTHSCVNQRVSFEPDWNTQGTTASLHV